MSFITNPDSGRACKVGGKVYKKLMREGKLSKNIDHIEEKDDSVLYEIQEDDTEEDIQNKKDEYDKELYENELQAVKGRGKYANKIVKRNRKLSSKEIENNKPIKKSDSCDDLIASYLKEALNECSLEDDYDNSLSDSDYSDYSE